MTRSLLFATLLVLCLPLAVRAGEVSVSPPPHFSAKLIGVTVLVGCPDESLRQGDPPQGRRAGGRLYRLSSGGRSCLVSRHRVPRSDRHSAHGRPPVELLAAHARLRRHGRCVRDLGDARSCDRGVALPGRPLTVPLPHGHEPFRAAAVAHALRLHFGMTAGAGSSARRHGPG